MCKYQNARTIQFVMGIFVAIRILPPRNTILKTAPLTKPPIHQSTRNPTHTHTNTHTRTQDTEEPAPIDQPRRLSVRRRSSFKPVEIIENESFIDIRLKPVTKDKVAPQKAQQSESALTKVTGVAIAIFQASTRILSLSFNRCLSLTLSFSLFFTLCHSVSTV